MGQVSSTSRDAMLSQHGSLTFVRDQITIVALRELDHTIHGPNLDAQKEHGTRDECSAADQLSCQKSLVRTEILTMIKMDEKYSPATSANTGFSRPRIVFDCTKPAFAREPSLTTRHVA